MMSLLELRSGAGGVNMTSSSELRSGAGGAGGVNMTSSLGLRNGARGAGGVQNIYITGCIFPLIPPSFVSQSITIFSFTQQLLLLSCHHPSLLLLHLLLRSK